MTSVRPARSLGAEPLDLASTERFEIRRRLGAGSFGIVYEGFDRERSATVAIKWLSYVQPDTVHRFKNEFRSLAEISHPNLVQLHDLLAEGDRWFFTMELVRGVPLVEHLRPGHLPAMAATMHGARSTVAPIARPAGEPAPAPFASASPPSNRPPMDVEPVDVRAVFSQLAQAVHALHQAGKLHRDLKCQNVLVTPDGRVVLLDFGLVRELERSRQGDEADIAGTPLYMAPEQCAGAPMGPAADWYAMGVMLYRALTGEYPFDGRAYEVMGAKQTRDAPRVESCVDGVPADLARLTNALLARRPSDRPSGADVLEALGVETTARVSFPPLPTDLYVGRRRQLHALEAARRTVKSSHPLAVYVHAPSGTGKTALVRRFLDRVREHEPETLILEGRCYERETLPYKALDSVVDSLVAYLRRVPNDACRALVPEHAGDLVRMFPGFDLVPAFHTQGVPLSGAPDPLEQRRRAITAFGDLIGRIASDRAVIVFIDDLQWGDRDSATLLSPLLDGPDAPRVLWLGTYRSDGARTSPYLEALGVGRPTQSERTVIIELPALDEEETRTLLELRLGGMARSEELLEELARQVSGSPLLVDLLVRRAKDSVAAPIATLDLASVIGERLAELATEPRRLVEALAVHGHPLETRLLARMMSAAADVTVLTQLRNGRLIRARESENGEVLDLYHDRIREVVLAQLEPPQERELHASLAHVLRESGGEPESLAQHYRGAGELAEAFSYTIEAARRAEQALAFERAAQLYRSALDLLAKLPSVPEVEPPIDEPAIRVALGDALRSSGRGADAARVYLIAAKESPRRRSLELRRLAAEQYLFSGHVDEGHAVLRTVLEEVGLVFPEHPVRVLAEFMARRAQVRLRGLKFRERRAEEITDEDLRRIDVCWSVALGLAMIDPVRGQIFQARHFLMALEAGELSRVMRAVAVEVAFCATAGVEAGPRTQELERIGEQLSDRVATPQAHAYLLSTTGGARWLEGRWRSAFELEERAIEIFRRECVGEAWWIASSTIVLLDGLWRTGRFTELFERLGEIIADAASRGDLLLEINLRIKFRSLIQLAADRPEDAIRESREALARWSQAQFQLVHLWDLYWQTEALLYEGKPEAAREHLQESWGALSRSQLLQLQMYAVTMRELEARTTLACAAAEKGRKRETLLLEASKMARRLERTGAPWARGHAALLEAGVAALRNDRTDAVGLLTRAEVRFLEADMGLHAEVARARRMQMERKKSEREAALEGLRARGIADPERWLALLAPGIWR
jgi:serine/threonine protein kinase